MNLGRREYGGAGKSVSRSRLPGNASGINLGSMAQLTSSSSDSYHTHRLVRVLAMLCVTLIGIMPILLRSSLGHGAARSKDVSAATFDCDKALQIVKEGKLYSGKMGAFLQFRNNTPLVCACCCLLIHQKVSNIVFQLVSLLLRSIST